MPSLLPFIRNLCVSDALSNIKQALSQMGVRVSSGHQVVLKNCFICMLIYMISKDPAKHNIMLDGSLFHLGYNGMKSSNIQYF